MPSTSTGRRAEYAELTREAIITAARELFAERGYFATSVNQIAERARVAPATVYAVTGGKHGLIATLVERWSVAPIVAERGALITASRDAREVLRLTAEVVRDMRVEYGDIMRTARSVAPHDEAVAESLRTATRRYRSALDAVADHLHAIGALGVDTALAADVLWFHFGFTGYETLVQENGWPYDRAAAWLAAQAEHALGIRLS
ncbi:MULTISPECIES: TetR/AcrR family transcriptional regulator [Actinomadura]|uniref:TetR/AcrR family transcriptional regulator n=1 Tax=Actinomadura yumaensis TaxID=111807 RepID=A0ABW2CK14_9ACTN|nr:TetR/AcrR family transcriptional regulator [Actinomadura sp. J1-007]MWK39896.1 TetR family transcriptional regulator [Actinomadura sp. J1-007]